MAQTVIGIFEQAMQAEDAKAYLIANGFDSDHIEIHGIAGSNYGNLPIAEDESIGERISHFFSNLFENEEDARAHAEAAGRATTLTVYTTDEDQTRQAVQVLDNFGAVDVDNFVQSGGAVDPGISESTAPEAEVLDSAEEANAPLDTDLINTDILNTEILENSTSDSQTIRRRSRVVDRPESGGSGLNSTNNSVL